jgi:hypothetical protein
MRDKMEEMHKAQILEIWGEYKYHQRYLSRLTTALYEFRYYDEELWTKIIDQVTEKKQLQNLYFV